MGEVTIYYLNPYRVIYMGIMTLDEFYELSKTETEQSFYKWEDIQNKESKEIYK